MSTIPTTAKAWRFPPTEPSLWNSYHSLELKDVPVPKPGKGEVLVKIRAVALNASLGQYPGGAFTTGPDHGGLIPASDGAGEIVAVGQGVDKWTTGDRVYSLFSETWESGPVQDHHWSGMVGSHTQGCLTQYRYVFPTLLKTFMYLLCSIFSAEYCLPVPEHLSYEQAAAIPCAGMTAFNALFVVSTTTQDSTVLVLGSGGVSVLGAQFAKAAGARVIATTSSESKSHKYKALGVDHVVNYRDTPDWADEVKKLTSGQGVDQVFEIGGSGTLMESIRAIKPGGEVHVISVPAEAATTSISELAMSLLLKQGKLNGVVVGGKDVGQRLNSFISEHKVEPLVDSKVFEWKAAKEAFDYIQSGAHFGKVVIRVD
ncbi:alcohol dehydrogenase zinc-binding domain protein [Rhizoctonia solani 123E]|uniref:Alcohol dehydrogenase zinc-binding domain protein n=1 Tax=Rhizoctonia solani 123E TaxID=1423351 RepID=A0A074RQA5_9AGAM|nr:alcohol dehydrogenase zinc-binding domain protein [Rhizoctonia solani 123E]